MDQRIIKYYAGELNSDERVSLLKEAFSNETLKKEMMDCQNLQSLMKTHLGKRDEMSVRMSLNRFMQARRAEKGRRMLFRMLRYAAVIFMCVLSTWWITYSFVGMDVSRIVTQELTVPAGQRAHLLLPDGSSVWVNAGSTLSYPSVFDKERRVKITGEAFFDVAKDEKPFIVSTGKMDVRALGTEFNVFNYPTENLTVSLLEGSVSVYPPSDEKNNVILKPDQQLIESDGIYKVQSITKNPIGWKDGLYAFDNQKMKDILKKLELYYDVKFTVKHPSILDYEYTGKFRQHDGVMEVLRIIQKIHPFKVKQVENTNEIILYQ